MGKGKVSETMRGAVTSGDRIGHYSVQRTLGEGGMGVVYLGADPEGRNVAIKVLRPAVAGDATARRRLAREVDSMRRVHSPHVAEILDADVTADQPYIVTQYVPAGRWRRSSRSPARSTGRRCSGSAWGWRRRCRRSTAPGSCTAT